MYKYELSELTKTELETIKQKFQVTESKLAEDMENGFVQIFQNIRGYLDWVYLDPEELDYNSIVNAFLKGMSPEKFVDSDARCTLLDGKVIFYNY